MAKKKSTYKATYKKGVTIGDFKIDEVITRRLPNQTEIISSEEYDDESFSLTIKIHYK